jgi:hypothetical protein
MENIIKIAAGDIGFKVEIERTGTRNRLRMDRGINGVDRNIG